MVSQGCLWILEKQRDLGRENKISDSLLGVVDGVGFMCTLSVTIKISQFCCGNLNICNKHINSHLAYLPTFVLMKLDDIKVQVHGFFWMQSIIGKRQDGSQQNKSVIEPSVCCRRRNKTCSGKLFERSKMQQHHYVHNSGGALSATASQGPESFPFRLASHG